MDPLLPLESLERLHEKVRAGRAVFFIGAGFSLDSEHISTLPQRLIRRLLALLLLVREQSPAARPGLESILRDFSCCFGLPKPERLLGAGPREQQELIREWTVRNDRMGDRYYEVNDWFCCTFEALLRQMGTLWPDASGRQSAALGLTKWDRHVEAGMTPSSAPGTPGTINGNALPLMPLDPHLITLASDTPRPHRHAAGKALFLDTLGFRGAHSFMQGEPLAPLPEEALRSYGPRLRARHRVLARLAREGWAPLLVTTNYDRLLEGGFRMAGFEGQPAARDAPPVPLPEWRTIAGPADFFAEGGGGRRALMVKLHGCSLKYTQLAAQLAQQPCGQEFQEYLRSMVFTYREIQNWREDGWSRDLVRTLLRTRTVVFCGYSARDQVIHDTLRGVYEEMAREKRRSGPGMPPPGAAGAAPGTAPPSSPVPPEAPAFFTVSRRSMPEFHGLEVLRSAFGAATGEPGRRREAEQHYLPFSYVGSGFGDPDDLFLWLWHRCLRQAQEEALETELIRTAGQLLGGPPRQSQVAAIRGMFAALCRGERQQAATWTDGGPRQQATARQEFQAMTGWTDGFHPALLREFAAMEAGTRSVRQGQWEHTMRQFPDYYFPSSAQGTWTAWGAVVELALRNLVQAGCGGYAAVMPARCRLTRRHRAGRPTLLLAKAAGKSLLPTALTLHCRGLARGAPPPAADAAVADTMVWELPFQLPPWPSAVVQPPAPSPRRPAFRATTPAPDARTVWRWALGTIHPQDAAWLDPTRP